tara:strand:+ start:141 stop:698 length:558 start_codon:yes stop_codon:yes gene_type:complete
MSTNKSFSTETSERYSRALFEVVKEANELVKVEVDIKNFLAFFDSSEETRNFIKNPTQDLRTQVEFVNLLANNLDFTKNLKNFLLLLIEKRRIFFVKKIFNSFMRLCSQRRGEIKASLISSKELTQSQLEDISKDLSSSIGSTLKFDYKVDKELIGGLKLQLGSYMIDTSIKNKLKKYKQVMLEK